MPFFQAASVTVLQSRRVPVCKLANAIDCASVKLVPDCGCSGSLLSINSLPSFLRHELIHPDRKSEHKRSFTLIAFWKVTIKCVSVWRWPCIMSVDSYKMCVNRWAVDRGGIHRSSCFSSKTDSDTLTQDICCLWLNECNWYQKHRIL